MPWPLKDRRSYVETASFLVDDESAIFTVLETLPSGQYFNETIKKAKVIPEMTFSDCAAYLKPIAFNHTLIKVIYTMEPNFEQKP